MRTVCPLAGSTRNSGGVSKKGTSVVLGVDLGSPLSIHICTRPGLAPSLVSRIDTSRSLDGKITRVPLMTTLAETGTANNKIQKAAAVAQVARKMLKLRRIVHPVDINKVQKNLYRYIAMKPRHAASLTDEYKKTCIPYGLLEFDCVCHARSRSTGCCCTCCDVLRQIRQVCGAISSDSHRSSTLCTGSDVQTTRDWINVGTCFEESTCIAAGWRAVAQCDGECCLAGLSAGSSQCGCSDLRQSDCESRGCTAVDGTSLRGNCAGKIDSAVGSKRSDRRQCSNCQHGGDNGLFHDRIFQRIVKLGCCDFQDSRMFRNACCSTFCVGQQRIPVLVQTSITARMVRIGIREKYKKTLKDASRDFS